MREIVTTHIDPRFRTFYVTGMPMKFKASEEIPTCSLELRLENEHEGDVRFTIPCSVEERALIEKRIRDNPASLVRFQFVLLAP